MKRQANRKQVQVIADDDLAIIANGNEVDLRKMIERAAGRRTIAGVTSGHRAWKRLGAS